MNRAFSLLIPFAMLACVEPNHQPTLDPVPKQVARVAEVLEIVLTGRDPDGDSLTYLATPMKPGAELIPIEGGALFRWAPLISDTGPTGKSNPITFTVEDGRGGRAERQVDILVLPQSSAPVFVGPDGYILNLSQDDDLSLTVAVSDDDSADVTLAIRGQSCQSGCGPGFECKNGYCTIAGSKFQKLDPKSASFYWRPTAEQLEVGNYWQLVVGARDESHEEVLREISILLMNGDAEKNCAGSSPVIIPCAESSCLPLKDLSGTGAIVFQGQGLDMESEIREMKVHYAVNNPLDPESYVGNELELLRCDPSTDPSCPTSTKERYFIGTMLNPAATATAPLLLYYYATAVDNDDIQGTACDHAARLPKEGYFTLATYPAGWTGGCKDDVKEPNDTLAQAVVLDTDVTHDLRSCLGVGSADWYRLNVTPGATLSAELLHDPSHGDLQLTVHDSVGTQLFPPLGMPAAEHLSVNPATSPVYLQVSIPSGASVLGDQTYGLVVNRSDGVCPNDSREPNDNAAQAVLLGSGSHDVVICSGDRDWMKVSAKAGESVVLNLDFQHSFGDLDMRLYRSDGVEVLSRSETATSGEYIVYHSQTEDTYYIEVLGYLGSANGATLDIQVVETGKLCFEDYLSPNHGPGQSYLLPENTYYDLSICPEKEDWFRLDMNANETLTVIAQPYFPSNAPLDLVVFEDEEGKLITGSQVPGAIPGQVRWVAQIFQAGTLRWRVRTPGSYTVIYDMAFGVSDPPGPCSPDRFNNHTVETAEEVDGGVGFVTRLKICPGTEDWFKIEGKAFEELFVYVFGFSSELPMAADLYRYEGDQLVAVQSGEPTTNGVEIVHLPEENMDYYIQVRGQPGAIHHYDLVIGLK